jgi:malate dehydrogenase
MAQAGAKFADYVLRAAFQGEKIVVQSYVDLEAASGGAAVQKELGSNVAYFSVNVELGVSNSSRHRDLVPR